MIFFECNADEALIRKLGCARKDREHLSGKSRVGKRLKDSREAIGMVDGDPESIEPPYFRKLTLIEERFDIAIYEDRLRSHRVITVKPRLEDWVIKTAQLAGLSMPEFGLSPNGNALHREINSRIPSFERLLEKLLITGSQRLIYLKKALQL